MTISLLTPGQTEQMLLNGAVLIDIRRPSEFNKEHIPQARSVPLALLEPESLDIPADSAIIFNCQTGHRARLYANRLEQSAQNDIYILDGGINAWKQAGLPVEKNASHHMSTGDQVKVAAGLLVIIGIVCGYFFSPWCYWIALLVAVDLVAGGFTKSGLLRAMIQQLPRNRH